MTEFAIVKKIKPEFLDDMADFLRSYEQMHGRFTDRSMDRAVETMEQLYPEWWHEVLQKI